MRMTTPMRPQYPGLTTPSHYPLGPSVSALRVHKPDIRVKLLQAALLQLAILTTVGLFVNPGSRMVPRSLAEGENDESLTPADAGLADEDVDMENGA